MGGRYVFDLETNDLLDNVTKVHSAVLLDIDTGEILSFTDASRDYGSIAEFLSLYQTAEQLIGFNSIKYDHAVIEKLYGIGFERSKAIDVMVLGRLIHPDIKSSDFQRAALWRKYVETTDAGDPWQGDIPREFPGKFVGAHSLKAWGYRLGLHKGEYDGGWEHWSPELHEYMLRDAEVTAELYRRFMAKEPSPQSVELEMRTAWLCAQIERNGFPFDVKKATELYGRLADEREELRRSLVGLFPNWSERLPDFIPARNNKTKGYVKGEPVERWVEHEFNPSSRDHIENRLRAKYDWKPQSFTDSGKATIDDEVLASLPYPEAKQLARSFLLDKRIGQLAEGNQAWLRLQKNGKIHASYNTNGAVTGRATHSNPNISQVPRVSTEFGRECRELFHAPPGWVLLGADQQGLELRGIASDMAAFDGGELATKVADPDADPHTDNQRAFGFGSRDTSKNCLYAICYGGQDPRIGSFVIEDAQRCKQAIPKLGYKKLSEEGARLRANISKQMPALPKLIDYVATAASRGWIKAIDGRIVPIRAPHKALNSRVQSSGAIICKRWGCDWEQALLDRGLKHGWDGDFCFAVWSHDEYQLCVRDDPATIEIVKAEGVRTGREAGLPYNFNCPLDVACKQGLNWAETH